MLRIQEHRPSRFLSSEGWECYARRETVDVHLPLFILLFPLDQTVSHRKHHHRRQNKTAMTAMLFLISLTLLR